MKNSSKNNYSEKNNKYKNSPDSKINSKKINSSKKNNRFLPKSSKNNGVNNFNSVNKNNFSTLNTRRPTYKSNLEALIKVKIFIKSIQIKKILMIGYGENTQFLRRLLVNDLLIGFGVQLKFFLLRNSISY